MARCSRRSAAANYQLIYDDAGELIPLQRRTLTGTLPLPPSITPLGPIVWRCAPATPELAECREIDPFSAVRTVLRAAAHTQGGGS